MGACRLKQRALEKRTALATCTTTTRRPRHGQARQEARTASRPTVTRAAAAAAARPGGAHGARTWLSRTTT
eukprot:scaffold29203_cov67-Phaeocystis_antarctica.AAC.6